MASTSSSTAARNHAKARRARKLAAEKRRIEKRLAGAVALNLSGPVLGRANIAYELAERSRGTAQGGMGMIAKVVKHTPSPNRSTPRSTCSRSTCPTTSPTMC